MNAPLAVGFLGSGQMATALARGWTAAGLIDPARSLASDPYPGARENFARQTGVRAVESNADVLVGCDVVVLAVKPQAMAGLLDEVPPWVESRHLFVSIAAGVTLKLGVDGFWMTQSHLAHKHRLVSTATPLGDDRIRLATPPGDPDCAAGTLGTYTWSVSASEPPTGSTIRRLNASVTPPVPSPGGPPIVLVCWKWGWLA